jgi:hypothetical protein
MRTVTRGLMTGQFALGAGAALDPDGTPRPNTEPIAPGAGAPTAGMVSPPRAGSPDGVKPSFYFLSRAGPGGFGTVGRGGSARSRSV